jgi:phosphate transport system substrate-binding protein
MRFWPSCRSVSKNKTEENKMKNVFYIIMLIVLIFSTSTQTVQAQTAQEMKGTVAISGAWALYPMTVKWAEEFQKIYPKIKVDIAAGGAGKGMADALAGVVDIGMVSRDIYPQEVQKGAWWVPVTKDAVVATVNENHPGVKNLLAQGIKHEIFQGIWITGKITNWNQVNKNNPNAQIHVYTRSDACGAAEIWARFLGKNQEDLLGVGVYGDPGLAEAVKKDVLGIGFNNINYAYDPGTKLPISGIKIVPIDLNNNGLVDNDENFYNSRDEIVAAIASGKYPSPPARDLNFVCHGKPTNPLVITFIKWVLSDGQKYVPEAGYINLDNQKLQEQLKKLEAN